MPFASLWSFVTNVIYHLIRRFASTLVWSYFRQNFLHLCFANQEHWNEPIEMKWKNNIALFCYMSESIHYSRTLKSLMAFWRTKIVCCYMIDCNHETSLCYQQGWWWSRRMSFEIIGRKKQNFSWSHNRISDPDIDSVVFSPLLYWNNFRDPKKEKQTPRMIITRHVMNKEHTKTQWIERSKLNAKQRSESVVSSEMNFARKNSEVDMDQSIWTSLHDQDRWEKEGKFGCLCLFLFYIHNRSEEQIKKNIIFLKLSLFIFWQFCLGLVAVVQLLVHVEELMVDHYSHHRIDISVFSHLV